MERILSTEKAYRGCICSKNASRSFLAKSSGGSAISSTGGKAPATVTPRFEKISQGLGLIVGRANSRLGGGSTAEVASGGESSNSSTAVKELAEDEAISPFVCIPPFTDPNLTLLLLLAAAAAF